MRPSRSRATTAVRGGIARDSRTVLFGGARRRRAIARVVLAVAALAVAAAAVVLVAVKPSLAAVPPPDARAVFAPAPPADDGMGSPPAPYPAIAWRASEAIGLPWDGRLVRGVQLPAEGPDWFTWDPVYDRIPDRGWRRYGTDALIRTLLAAIRTYREAHPEAPRVGVGDLSRRHGGPFGARYGGLGHASHQNGLDVDVWYPRADDTEARAARVSQIDHGLAQALVDAFREAGAQKLFVGPHVGLHGPTSVVIPLAYHDDHVHVRIPPPPG
jgi:murein endopeptidase